MANRDGVEDGSGWGGLVSTKAERQADAADAVYRDCNRYALGLVTSLAKRFPAVPGWKPLPDLLGKLTQIDSMTAKLSQGFGGDGEGVK